MRSANSAPRDRASATPPGGPKPSDIRNRLVWALWLLLLISVPITSAPVVAALLGPNPVSPMAMIPAAGILIVWLVPYLIKGGQLPALALPLFVFAGIALLSSLVGFGLPILPYKGQDLLSREIRALGSLGLGISIYLFASCIPNTEDGLKRSLRAIYVGGIFVLAWSTVQATFVLAEGRRVPLVLTNLHHLLSIRDLIYNRVTGFSFEPSWLGKLLLLLYLPLWLGGLLTRSSVISRPPKWPVPELVLTVWGLAILYLTRARISWLSLLAITAAIFLSLSWTASSRMITKLLTSSDADARIRSRALRALWLAVTMLALVGLVAGSAWLLSKVDRRMGRLFSTSDQLAEFRYFYAGEVGFQVADRLAFGERVSYWAAAYGTYEAYPILGVGLGNSGFFFEQMLPAYAYRLAEFQRLLDGDSPNFPNPKNLWIRLLAETGLVGFCTFAVWLGLLAITSLKLRLIGTRLQRMVAVAALLALTAQLLEGFSLDTFALPQLWIILGLLTAAARQAPELLGSSLQEQSGAQSATALPTGA